MGSGAKNCEVDWENGVMSGERQGEVPVAPGARTVKQCSLDGRNQGLNPVAPLGKFSSHEGVSGRKKREL